MVVAFNKPCCCSMIERLPSPGSGPVLFRDNAGRLCDNHTGWLPLRHTGVQLSLRHDKRNHRHSLAKQACRYF